MKLKKSDIDSNISSDGLDFVGNKQRTRRGYNDIWYCMFKGLVVVVTVFVVSYFLMNDLKSSEGKKITQSFLRAAQENIRILEVTGDSINNYLAANEGVLDSKDASFVWDMIYKSHLASMLLWHTYGKDKWLQMTGKADSYSITEYSDSDINVKNFLKDISAFPRTKTLLNINTLKSAFSDFSYYNNSFRDLNGHIAWLFTRFRSGGGFDFLIVLSNIKDIFSLDSDDSNFVIHNIKLSTVYDNNVIFEYNYNNNKGFFRPLELQYGIMMAGDSWNVDIVVSPTMAYIIFVTLPWIILFSGLSVVIANGIYLHRQYRNENQLAYISETLADKNTELLSWEAEKKKMIKEFQKSEWEYKAIINAVSDVIFEVNKYGKFLFLNETWNKLVGKNKEKVMGETIFDYIHPKDRAYHDDMFQEFISGYRGAYRSEARFKTGEGEDEYRFVELAFSMMRVTNNEPRVVGTITDIEKRKKAEIAHRAAEKKYKEMFKNALNGIYQATPSGKFINVNQAFANIMGYSSPEELMENIDNISQQIYVDTKQRLILEMQVTRQGMTEGVEIEVLKKDGSKAWLLENIRSVYDDNGDVEYFEGTVWDITKRREIDQALRKAKLEADLTSRARIEFMANMSHELRTPLNAVIGFSEIIRNEVMGPIEQEAYKEYAEDIHNSGKQLLGIINDILELSQIEIGERELKENEFPILRVVQSVLDLLQHKIKKARLEVTVDIPKDIPKIFAEELAFKQIFMNILSNSVKFTPENGKITISAKLKENGAMIIDITDTGVGMTDDELEKALQPFGQVETEMSRDNSGTGLGLSIVQSLVELHGGRFVILSKKGKGTTVKLEFPKERTMLRSTGDTEQLSSI